jgi:8-oxo-dGTP pyrophosphatase MutT (NUDIX family)
VSFNPRDVPVRPAATVMVLDDRPDLHVLLLRRRAGSDFVGGMTLFPGGGVDVEDASAEAERVCIGLDDAEASRRLRVERGGLAYYVAAIRETFEEAGLLLARRAGEEHAVDLAPEDTAKRFAAHREAVDAGRVHLTDVARAEGLSFVTDAVHYVGRWITPLGPPRRYDTRFFVTAAPPSQKALACERETVHSEWLRPADATERFARGERVMLPPTLAMLRLLADYTKSADAISAARAHEDGTEVRPRLIEHAESWRVLLPGDDDFDIEGGYPVEAWLRLPPRARG